MRRRYEVTGMGCGQCEPTCDHCVRTVAEALATIEGAVIVEVDGTTHRVVIDGEISAIAVQYALSRLGVNAHLRSDRPASG